MSSPADALDRVAETMADALVTAITARPLPHAIEHLYLTDPIADLGRIDGVMFSGGVGEYVYGREERDFGDMGRRLGAAMRRRIEAARCRGRCCRPASASARPRSARPNTACSSAATRATSPTPGALLPRRNLQVLQPQFACDDAIDPDALAAAIRAHFTAFDLTEGRGRRGAGAALARGAVARAAVRVRARHRARAWPTRWRSAGRSTSCSTATWRRRSARSCARSSTCRATSW